MTPRDWLALLLLLLSVLGIALVEVPPSHCYTNCSDSPCTSSIGCGLGCTCIKVGSETEGFCASIQVNQ